MENAMTAELRSALECPICFEVMKQPIMFASCGHSFCSLCIRRFLQQTQLANLRAHCPTCNTAQEGISSAEEGKNSGLVKCLALNHLIDTWNRLHNNDTKQPAAASEEEEEEARLTPISRLSTPVYHLMSDEKLDQCLRAYNLPVHSSGSGRTAREQKISLLREYTLQINTLCDSGQKSADLDRLVRAVVNSCKTSSKARNPFEHLASKSESAPQPSAAKRAKFTREHAALRAHERTRWRPAVAANTWRAIFSDALNRPVYFNTETKECTTLRPPPSQDEEEEGTVVIVLNEDT